MTVAKRNRPHKKKAVAKRKVAKAAAKARTAEKLRNSVIAINKQVLDANDRFVRSGIVIKDVYGNMTS